MDDTKKMIEKYKRELMEMSRTVGKPQPAPEPKKAPRIIGYVDEENKAYDSFLKELGRLPMEGSVSAPSDIEDAAEDTENTFPDEIFGASAEEGPMDDLPSDEDAMENNAEDVPEREIDPQTETEPLEESAEETIDEPFDEPLDETVEDGEPLFSRPNYTEIPSTEQVRNDITDESVPSENRPDSTVSGVSDNSSNTPRADRTDAEMTTNEQAERLGDQPVSGQDPDEQLTGRSFEEKLPPPPSDADMARGSGSEPGDFPRAIYTSYDDFIRQNPAKGTILFRVYTGRQAVPLENAQVVIFAEIDGKKHEMARLKTDSSGQTPLQELPAPDKELSQNSQNKIQAFAMYDATVTKKGYSQVVLEDIPVFDGVQSVQRVFMIVNA